MANGAKGRVLIGGAEGKLMEIRLSQEDGAGLPETRDDRCVIRRDVTITDFAGCRGCDASEVDDVLQRYRHPVEGAAILSAGELGVGLFCLCERLICQSRDVGVNRGISLGDPFQATSRGRLSGQRTRADRARATKLSALTAVLTVRQSTKPSCKARMRARRPSQLLSMVTSPAGLRRATKTFGT